MTRADRLAQGNNIGNRALLVKGPHVRSGAAKADLHFISDAKASRLADDFVGPAEKTCGRDHLTSDASIGFGDEERRFYAPLDNDLLHFGGIGQSHCLAFAAMLAAIAIGHRSHMDKRLAPLPALAIELVGTDVDQAGGVAVIGDIQHHRIMTPGGRAGHAHGKFVGFRTRTGENAGRKARRHGRNDAIGIVQQ